MNSEEIRATFQELPGGPFTVHLAEQTEIKVAHPDFAMISPTGRTLSVWDLDGHMHHIGADAVTRISHSVPAERTGP